MFIIVNYTTTTTIDYVGKKKWVKEKDDNDNDDNYGGDDDRKRFESKLNISLNAKNMWTIACPYVRKLHFIYINIIEYLKGRDYN